ncbi:Dennd4c protein [Aphelenchoides avenae]|nr:Dennd4c protein [Aphelenchus avenae]
MGAVIESWSEKCGPPEKLFSTCVLTDELGTKYYGASLTFYERFAKPLTEAQLEKLEMSNLLAEEDDARDKGNDDHTHRHAVYHCNKAICVVSRHPFFESFRRFLYFVYGVSVTGAHKIPIERYISHLMHEVQFPSPSRPRVLVQLGNDMISFDSHDDSQIPLSGATFVDALRNLGAENFIYAMLLALLEQKILVHSLRPWLLTSVSETICALMFPFHWQCPYIPQCPLALAGVLHAPLPFIAGVDSRYFDLYEEPPTDVTCFDLDTATVSHSVMRKSLKLSLLPKKPCKRLRLVLETVQKQMTNSAQKKSSDASAQSEQQLQLQRMGWEMTIREAFLRFMCTLMSGYSDYLRPIVKNPRRVNATDTGALFDLKAFLESRDKNSQDFYRRFSETQCFIRFIEERSFLSDKNVYNVFFDDCIRKMLQEGTYDCPLLDRDAFASNHTAVVPPARLLNPRNADKKYRYEHFPTKFDTELFETDLILKAKQENLPSPQSYNESSDKEECAKLGPNRTKQEVRTSLAEATKFNEESSLCWPRTLLFYGYSLWFQQLSALIEASQNKIKMLRLAFRVIHDIVDTP